MMSHTIAHLTKNFKTLLMSHKSWLYASYFANFRSRGQTLPVSKSSTWSRAANNRSRFKVDIWIEWRFWWVTTHWTMLFLEVFAIDTQLLHWSFILDFLLGRHLSKSVLLDSIEKISSKTKKSLLCNHSHLLSSSRHLLGWPKPDHADQRIEFRFELWKKSIRKKVKRKFPTLQILSHRAVRRLSLFRARLGNPGVDQKQSGEAFRRVQWTSRSGWLTPWERNRGIFQFPERKRSFSSFALIIYNYI